MTPPPSPLDRVRQINRTWAVRGHLAEDTERYLADLEVRRPQTVLSVCERAIAAARLASSEQRDPKPGFYATIFSRATPEERETFLKDHLWTRELSAKLQSGDGG